MDGEETQSQDGQSWDPSDWQDPGANNTWNTDGTTASTVFDNSTQSTGNDAWGGFWKGIGGAVQPLLNYAVAKDAAKSGLVAGYSANGQPIYTKAAVPVTQQKVLGNLSGGAVLLLGGVVIAALVVAKKG